MIKYPIYNLYKRRVKEDFGLYPINALTSSGKSSAIKNLYTDPDYDKFTICISNDRKNTKSMYESHKNSKDCFDNESLMLFSTKDHMIYRLTKDESHRKSFEKFFHDYDYVSKNPKKDKPLSLEIMSMMINLDDYNRLSSFKSIFMKNGSIKASSEIKANIEGIRGDDESVEISSYRACKNLLRKALFEVIKKRYPNMDFYPASKEFKSVLVNDSSCYYFFDIFQELNLIKKDTGDLKRVYLNIHKFLSNLSTGYPLEVYPNFYRSSLIDGAVIFIDESDDCYEKMLDFLSDRSATNSLFDYLSNLLDIVFKISIDHWAKSLNSDNTYKIYKNLYDSAWKILNKYGFMQVNFKIKNPKKDKSSLIFYDDSSNEGVVLNNYKFYVTDSINYILFDDERAPLDDNGNKFNEFLLSDLLKDLSKFFKLFKKLLIKQIELVEEENDYEDDNTSSIMSVLNFYVNKGSSVYDDIYEDVLSGLNISDKDFLDPDKGAIYNGFNLFLYKDLDKNDLFRTTVTRDFLKETPEKILYYMAKKAVVIPISATARVVSRYKNFLYNDIESWLNFENFYYLSDEEIDFLKSDYLNRTTRLNLVDTKIFKIPEAYVKKSKNVSLNNLLDELIYVLPDKGQENLMRDLSIKNLKVYNKLNSFYNEGKEYELNRVLNLLYVIKIYKDEDLNHGVVLTSFNINRPNKYISDDDIKEFVKYLDPNIKCFFADSKNYDDKFKKANLHYCKHKKSLIFTSYKNLSTGQNLSFDLSFTDKGGTVFERDPRNFIEPNNDGIGDFTKVDIDFLYLSDITHLGIRDKDCFEGKDYKERLKNRVKYIYQLERVDSLGGFKDLSAKEKELEKLSKFSSDTCKSKYEPMDKWFEIYRVVVQSVGRSFRNALSHPKRVICAMGEVIDADYYKSFIKEDLVSNEVDKLLSCAIHKNSLDISYLISEANMRDPAFDKYISDLAGDIRNNPNVNNISEFEEFRVKDLLFPFYKDGEDLPDIPNKEKAFCKTNKPSRAIFVYNDKHYTVAPSNKSLKISPDVFFIRDLCENSMVRDILKREGVRVPKDFETFSYFPVKSLFINVVKGLWGEFISEKVLCDKGIIVYTLQDVIYEIADGVIETDNKVIFIDYKNFSESELRDYNDSVKLKEKALDKIDLIKKRTNLYDNKEIYFCYLNVYDGGDYTRVIDMGENIYDLGSVFYKDRKSGVVYSNVDKKIREILN